MNKCIVPGCNKDVNKRRICNTHYFRHRKYGCYDLPKTEKRLLFDQGLGKCAKCGKIKLLSEFYIDKQKSVGIAADCVECTKYKAKIAHNKRKRTASISNIHHKYGITLEQYNTLLAKQDYKCAICGKNETEDVYGRVLCIDHNHENGKIRGVLCHSCNRGLGMFHDNIDILNGAIKYLEKHNA